MKVLQGFLAFALCIFAQGAKALGIDYTKMNDVNSQEIKTSLEKTIGYAKSMIQSMEVKLSEAQKYAGMLEDKLKVCGQNNALIDHLVKKLITSEEISKEYFIRMKLLEDRIIKSEQDQIAHAESVTSRLLSLENRLPNIGELEKIYRTESLITRVEKIEKKMKVVENIPFENEQKSSVNDIVQNASSSEVKKTTKSNTSSDNNVAVNMWNESSTDRNDNQRNQLYFQQENGVTTDIFRGFRTATDDRVAFRASGISRGDGHYSGERIIFASLDYNEGGGFDLSSGTFNCPTTGTYFFTATIGSANRVYIDAVLKIDGVIKMSLYAGFHLQGDNMSTAVTIARCRAGQSVWMEVTNGDHLGGWEAISGFLLWSDVARR
ncbi:hypothetical protein CHS0354_006567 [Potamilus streckersoni]|uniref:C1q domain-containing protein n=1 Tax=Potamilus streckersoni TaxID=2493646 RepID=A0AAE0WBZ7_9BIVA|nr:hypothetical protein CHS0354_006567 [Potamilus streckersoni]